ncbi:MAG: MFS transporter [Methanomassiliicoccales archaeon]|nr:MFS transporter [Methanomassiliicoccales archaeon]
MNPNVRYTLILSFVAFVALLGSSLISPILPFYALAFGVSLTLVGALVSSFGLASVILDIPSGYLFDRFGAKRLMVSGLFFIFLSALICAFASNYSMLLFGRVLSGVGYAIYTVTSFTCMGKIAPNDHRGRYMSFYLGMLLLGSVCGPALGGLIGESFGLRMPFIVYGVSSLLSCLLVHFGIGEELITSSKSLLQTNLRSITSIFKNYTLVAINLAIFAIFFIRMGVVSTLVPIFASKNLGLSVGMIGGVLAIAALINFLTMLPVGSLTDRYGRKNFMFASLFIIGLLTIAIPFAKSTISLVTIMAGLGFGFGFSGPIMAWVTDTADEGQLGLVMGIFRTMSDLGFIVGPLILSVVASSSLDGIGYQPFALAGFLAIMTSIFILMAKESKK